MENFKFTFFGKITIFTIVFGLISKLLFPSGVIVGAVLLGLVVYIIIAAEIWYSCRDGF